MSSVLRVFLCLALIGALTPVTALAADPGPVHDGVSVTAAEADDDIPGVQLASLPATGHLSPTDTSDVYQLRLASSDQVSISITGTGTLLSALALYPRNAESVATTDPITVSASGTMSFEVPDTEGGVYYLQVKAESGEGDYALQLDEHSSALTDDPDRPGTFNDADLVSEPTFFGYLNPGDVDCGYLWIARGEKVDFALRSGPTYDAVLELYSPGMSLAPGSGGLLASSDATGHLSYTAPEAGYYPIAVLAPSGTQGGYEVSVSRTPAPPWGEQPDVPNNVSLAPTFTPPVSGGIDNAAGDYVDVYAIEGVAGQVIDLHIRTTSPNLNCTFQDPYMWGYWYPVQQSPGHFRLTTRLQNTSKHYLYLSSWSEPVTYTIDYSLGVSDDIAPGPGLETTPLQGSLAFPDDRVDHMSVMVDNGDFIEASLEASPNLDADLLLTHAMDPDPIAASRTTDPVERVVYQADGLMQMILQARAVTGSGNYTLDWRVREPAGDDQVPGTPLVAGGTVNASSTVGVDRTDIYSVSLEAGKRYRFRMTGSGSPRLSLLPTDTADVYTGQYLDYAEEGDHGAVLTYSPQASGTYFLRADNYATGSYTIVSGSQPIGTDDAYAESPFISGEASGTLDSLSDSEDWYRVTVPEGRQLGLKLTYSDAADFDICLYDGAPGSSNMWSSDPHDGYKIVQATCPLPAGTYYVKVSASSGSGAYALRAALPVAVADDTYPGPLTMEPSPIMDTVNELTDFNDSRRIWLEGGQEAVFRLSTPVAGRVLMLQTPAGESTGASDQYARFRVPYSGFYTVYISATGGDAQDIPYVLTWTYDAMSEPDDDAPGVPLAPATDPDATSGSIDGSLTAMSDRSDVYRVNVPVGKKLEAHLSYEGDADLWMYGFDDTVASCDMAEAYWYSDRARDGSNNVGISIRGQAGRAWYLQVEGWTGDADYTLDWQIVDDDDRMPVFGVESPVLGTVDEVSDASDFIGLSVKTGQVVRASLKGDPGTDFDLVFGSGRTKGDTSASSLRALREDPVLAYSRNEGSSERVMAIVPEGGNYAFEVEARSGRGAYTLEWTAQYDVTARLASSPKTPAYNQAFSLTGSLLANNNAGANEPVKLYQQVYGGTWRLAETQSTDASGRFAFNRRVTTRTAFKVVYAGDEDRGAAVSNIVTVVPTASLAAPSGRPIYEDRDFVASGRLYPRHSAGTRAVKIKCQQYFGGAWHTRKTVSATLSDVSGGSAYAVRASLPNRGRWRLVSYHSDATHAYTEKAGAAFTVK